MALLEPEFLADVCSLSLPLAITGMVLGLVLWAFGWRTHRFWVVLMMTVLAGIYGLYEAPVFQAQPVLASLLLALAAGILALSLVRLLAFVAGGGVGLFLLQTLAPTWNQPLPAFLVSGLIGLFLFRIWMMALTSFTGTLLLAFSGMNLLHHFGTVDVMAWAQKGTSMFTWGCGLMTLVGLSIQFFLDRRRSGKSDKKSGKWSGPGDGDYLLALPLWGWKGQRKAG